MMKGISTQELQALILSVGTHRANRPLSPLEVAQLVSKAMECDTSIEDCAMALGVGHTQVRTFMKLLDLTTEIQHLADWRGSNNASISFSSLAEVARLRPPDQVSVAEAILAHSLKWKEIVQIVQISQRSCRGANKCINDVLALRPQVETLHLFIGSITSESTTDAILALLQTKRDQLMVRAIREVFGSDYKVTGRLGPSRFTLLSNHNISSLLGISPDDLEISFNQCINQGLAD